MQGKVLDTGDRAVNKTDPGTVLMELNSTIPIKKFKIQVNKLVTKAFSDKEKCF